MPRVFGRRYINGSLKGLFVSSTVFALLLYGLQYCSFGKREQRCIDGYYLRLANRVLKLQYDHHLLYETATERLSVEWPSQRLLQERLCWL